MFQPLSVAAKERVAANLAPQSVLAGEVVIRAGERGDRFYIVGNGALEITGDGLRTTADEGDYFDEIALLRDVPQTAISSQRSQGTKRRAQPGTRSPRNGCRAQPGYRRASAKISRTREVEAMIGPVELKRR